MERHYDSYASLGPVSKAERARAQHHEASKEPIVAKTTEHTEHIEKSMKLRHK